MLYERFYFQVVTLNLFQGLFYGAVSEMILEIFGRIIF
jgi:hypothetical protein